MRRAATLACLLICASTAAPGALAQIASDDRVVLSGVGTAHGLGMAMDGVVGQARAGWSHDRILSLFYPGTSTSKASGTIRVGLADGPRQSFVLPGGGTVSTGNGSPLNLGPGGRVTTHIEGGRVVAETAGARAPAASSPAAPTNPRPSPDASVGVGASLSVADGAIPVAPILTPSPTPPPAGDSPTPPPTPGKNASEATSSTSSVRVTGAGDPALVLVEATGKRYRGAIEVAPSGGTLRVVNLVDLEIYVEGIAEARGAGWPLEGMKALAVAARSLGAASMSWYTKSRPNGFDICPTQNCQVYLGYDGEEAIMRRAVQETSGQIRTFNGRPILAMYHGNGGGQTESYRRVALSKVDSHPYLKSVRYPHAAPSTWRREMTLTQIGASLAAHGVVAPRPIERIEVLERGFSPRVMRMRLHGDGRHRDLTGTTFAQALDLWSTWFEISGPGKIATSTFAFPGQTLDRQGVPRDAGSTWVLAFAAAIVALATAGALQATAARLPVVLRRLVTPPATPAPEPPAP